MKYAILFLGLLFATCGAEKINWKLTNGLDWSLLDAQKIKPKPQEVVKKDPAKKLPEISPKAPLEPQILYYYDPQIIYTQPKSIRYYRYPENLWRSCK